MKATHKPKTVIIGNQAVVLNPGQFIFGRKIACHETCLSEQNVRTALKVLIAHQQITIKTTNKYSIVTLINWDIYQPEPTHAQPAKQPSDQPTDNQQITTYKNNKEVSNNIKDSADAGQIKKTDEIAEKLYRAKKFDKVHAFVNKMRQLKKNESAICHILTDFGNRSIPEGSAWAYCYKGLERESGNFNEQQYRQRIEKMKKDFNQWERQLNQAQ